LVKNTYIIQLHKYISYALFKVGQRNTLMKETELKHMSFRYICKDAMLSIVYRLFSSTKIQSYTFIDFYRLHTIVNYKINADVPFSPSFETYRRRVDLLLYGSNFRQIHMKMKLKLLSS